MKKINSGVYFVIIVAFVCLFVQTGHAATYYVKNSGDDNASGLDDNSAWRTISKVNSFVFSQGDTVLFKRGDTFADSGLRKTNVENFTIADYGEGKKPLFDGNKIKPVHIEDSKNITIKNIDISGQEWAIGKSSNLGVYNVEGVIIDGIYGNGHTFEGEGQSDGKIAISIYKCSGEIEVKNCELFNWGPYDLFKPDALDFIGISMQSLDNSAEYSFHNNVIHDVNADCIHVYNTKAKGKIHDNTLYNGGENSIDVKDTENLEIYDNVLYRTSDFVGEGGSGSGGVPGLIVVHKGQYRPSKNITIRSNTFRDGDAAGIKISVAEDIYIYGNTFSNVKSALFMHDYANNVKFHHNIVENPQSRMTSKGWDAGSIYENNPNGTGTEIYNNTIYNGTGDCEHLMTIATSTGTAVYNNIVYQNNSSEDAFALYRSSNGTEPVIRDNYWYNPNKINRTKYSYKIYTANMQEEWNEKNPGDKFDDPLMNDPEERDYSLYDKSLKIGALYGDQAEESFDDTLMNDPEEGQDVIIDNLDPEAYWVGDWQVSGGPNPYGEDSVWSRWGSNKVTWYFTPLQTSDFELLMWWTELPSRSTSVPVDIEHAGGTSRVIIDQSTNGGRWNSLGVFFFVSGHSYSVTITAQPGPSSTCADAVRFVQH